MMQYINLAETAVSRATLRIITGKWKHSLEDLSLPDRYVRLFQLHGLHGPVQEHDDFKRQIDSITNLDRLHVGHYRFGEIDVNNRRKSTKVMTEMFPTLSINLDPFGEAGPSNSNPDNKFNSTIKPRNWARRLWNNTNPTQRVHDAFRHKPSPELTNNQAQSSPHQIPTTAVETGKLVHLKLYYISLFTPQ